MPYLGSSIVSFSEQGSFGGSSGEITCDISLVDCAILGDMFNPPTIGTPSAFTYKGHTFFGIVDRYSTVNSSSAHPQYTVHLSNGLFLVQGVKIILNDYYGASNAIPNLVNVFGYLENTGFGNSEVNSAGISWNKVATALTTIVNTAAGTSYGGTIQHKSFKYGLDLSNLPNIPNYYRINSDSISLLEFIQEVCEAGGCDFFIRLETTAAPGLDGKFVVYTISRLSEPTPGAVENFVNNSTCVSQKEVGQELRKDSTSKFVVGANLERMWFVEPASSGSISGGISSAEYAGYNVLPYFGEDSYGNYIIGETPEDEPDEYYFDIDIRDVAHPNLGDIYQTSYSELQAVKKGRESWERFLSERACNKYVILPAASCGVTVNTVCPFVFPVPTGTYKETTVNPTGEYGGIMDGYNLCYIPKYGYDYLLTKAKVEQNAVVDIADYYYPHGAGSYPPDYFFSSYCEVNSLENISPAGPDILLWNLYYPATDTLNPYFLRAFKIGNVSPAFMIFVRSFESDLYRLSTSAPIADRPYFEKVYLSFQNSMMDQYAKTITNMYNVDSADRYNYALNNIREKSDHLYRKLKTLADNNLGKKFLITIPSMDGAIEPESNQLRLSQEPTEAGYLDESVWDSAYASGLIPEVSGLNILLSPEEKFYPFVKLENAVLLSGDMPIHVPYNYSEISQTERYLGNPVHYTGLLDGVPVNPTGFYYLDLWARCSISPNIVYQDTSTLSNPRVIVDLPGTIKYDPDGDYASVQAAYKVIQNYAKGHPAGAYYNDASFTDTNVAKMLNKFGVDEIDFGLEKYYYMPDLFAVPLRSNILCYGPWYLAGANGPVEYEKNNDLAPWNYGGFTPLDSAGFARVNDGVTNQTFDETGSVTVAGAPALNIGDVLIAGGPYITDINVTADSNGINTQYTFQSWSSQRRLSKLTNFTSERVKRLSQTSRDLRRAYREGVSSSLWSTPNQFLGTIGNRAINLDDLPRRDKGTTSHKVISGEIDGFVTNVVAQPLYNMSAQLNDSYENKAVMSLDGIFRPYSNIPHDNMPSLTMPEDTGNISSSLHLHPLKHGHGISVLTGSSDDGHGDDTAANLTTDITINESGVANYRGIGLAGPIVISAWGKDINGDPVPLYVDDNGDPILSGSGYPLGSGVKQWRPDYLYNYKEHKTGPLDIKWDEERGVWSVDGGSKQIRFDIVSSDPTTGEALVNIQQRTFSGQVYGSRLGDTVVTVYDTAGCYLNEIGVDLTGRSGFAMLFKTNQGAIDAHFSEYDYPEWYWMVTGLCCPSLTCE